MVKFIESLFVHEIKNSTTNELKIVIPHNYIFSFKNNYTKKSQLASWDFIKFIVVNVYSTSILIGSVYLTPTAFPLCLPGFIFGSNFMIRIASF